VPHWTAANPNKDPNCQKKVTIHYGSKKVTARVVDKCMSCGRNNIDVSPAVFKKFGPLSKGHYQVKWNLHN
jgi:expansin (peptidoglycan-binding protein)